MKYRRLGRTQMRVSEIGFGGLPISGDQFGNAYGPTDDNNSRKTIKTALDAGINFFDTADIFGHGHSEALIGEVVAQWKRPEDIIFCTKGGIDFYRTGEEPRMDFTPYGIAHSVEQSRMRLRRDCIDLYLLLEPPLDVLMANDRAWQTLQALQRANRIGAFGISVADLQTAITVLKHNAPIDALEVTYNLFDQAAVQELLPLAAKRRVGVIVREPLANGLLGGKHGAGDRFPDGDLRSDMPGEYIDAMAETMNSLRFLANEQRTMAQAALRFVLDQPGVTTVIPGMKSPQQVLENAAASTFAPITHEERLAVHHVFFPEDRYS